MARTQSRIGHSVRVICVNHADTAGNDVTWDKLATTPTITDFDHSVEVIRCGRVASFARLEVCPRLLSILRQLNGNSTNSDNNIDVLHLHAPNPTMFLALCLSGLLSQKKIAVVIGHHSDIIKQKVLRIPFAPFEEKVYANAQAILVATPTYSTGSPLLKRHESRVHVVPYGIDLHPYLQPTAEVLKKAQEWKEWGSPLWLMVGRLIYYKAGHIALQALRDLPGKLIFIGTGPLLNEWQLLADQYGVADRVLWLGNATPIELIAAYHAATAFWFPSNARSEAFGLVQVEAMASSCPVINTAIPGSGTDWVSLSGISGLTVPINDPVALAQSARQILADPSLRQRLGQMGRKRAQTEFEQNIMAKRIADIYEEIKNETY